MVFTHKSLLNINERIFLYLLDNPYQSELPDATEDLTAFKIAKATASNSSNIFYNLNKLKENDYINDSIKYVKGKKKKQKQAQIRLDIVVIAEKLLVLYFVKNVVIRYESF